MSSVYIRNKRGPMIDAWRHLTIQVVGPISPHSLGLVDSFQRGNSESSAEVEDSCRLIALSLSINVRWGTESKAFLKSKKIAPTSLPLSSSCNQLWVVSNGAVVVDFPRWKPNCES